MSRRSPRQLSDFVQALRLLCAGWEGRAVGMQDRDGKNEGSAAFERAARELAHTINLAGLDSGTMYEGEAVLTRKQLAEALHCTERTLERSSLPVSYALGKHSPRYVWRQVVAHLESTVP